MNNDTVQPSEATNTDDSRNATDPLVETDPDTETSIARSQLATKDTAVDVIDKLVLDLHTLILIFITAVYYLDCFAILFLLRFFGQNQLKEGGIRLLLTVNILCIATHVLHSLPQPEPREFWNHGGALVDFVGEKPSSKTRVLGLDCMIVGLQLLYLALYYKRSSVDDSKMVAAAQRGQDLDAEEAGVLRANATSAVESDEGIELQPMLGTGLADETSQVKSRDEADRTILLRKKDWTGILVGNSSATETDENSAALRGFVSRLSAMRARVETLTAQPAASGGS